MQAPLRRTISTGHGSGVADVITDISVAAHSGPLGEDPHGHVGFTTGIPLVNGQVRCLAEVGTRAAVGTEDPMNPGFGAYLIVQDNEEVGGPDLLGAFTTSLPPSPFACLTLVSDPVPIPVTSGDFRVRDALP
jgi:hypothetical protein